LPKPNRIEEQRASLASVRDLASVAVLLVIALALHARFTDSPDISKDCIAYIVFSQLLFSDFALHLPAWIHVDRGMILPPLFPSLIGLASALASDVDGDAILVAKRVSAICLSLASVPLFFLLSSRSNRAVAILAIGSLNLSLHYLDMGHTGLTEASFVLVVAATLLVLQRTSETLSWHLGILLGVSCALAFLTRQVGLIALPFCLGWLVLAGWAREATLRRSCGALLAVSLGFLAVFGSYAGLLYAQTGQHPLQQKFRWHRYAVSSEDPNVLSKIERIQALPVGKYNALYAKRRLMFQLTPDGAEMYSFLLGEGGTQAGNVAESTSSAEALSRIAQDAIPNLKGNLLHLEKRAGPFTFWIFVLATLSVCVLPTRKWSVWRQRLVLAFVWSYLIVLSLLGDLVARYVDVLLPFVVIAIAIEAFRVVDEFTGKSHVATLTTIAVVGVGAFLTPRIDFSDAPESREARWPKATFRGSLEPHARVMTMHPLDSYLMGGTWMLLPNDSLEQIVEYGRKTGTHWLLVARYYPRVKNERYYTKATWYRYRDLETRYPDLVQRCHLDEAVDYRMDLYRIRPADVRGSSDPNACAPVIVRRQPSQW